MNAKTVNPETVPSTAVLAGYLGEGFHTAFRKATDTPRASRIWQLIDEMPDDEWVRCTHFVAEAVRDALLAGSLLEET